MQTLSHDPDVMVPNVIAARLALLQVHAEQTLAATARRKQWLAGSLEVSVLAVGELKRIAARVAPDVALQLEAVTMPAPREDTLTYSSGAAPQQPRTDLQAPIAAAQHHQHQQHYQQQQQQQAGAGCPADLAEYLIHAPPGASGLPPDQLAVAVRSLAPAALRRLSPAFFHSLLPTLLPWLSQPQHAAHAFSLLHEGFCAHPTLVHGIQARVVHDQLRAVFLRGGRPGEHHAQLCGIAMPAVLELMQYLAGGMHHP
jgi:hypothetical protein